MPNIAKINNNLSDDDNILIIENNQFIIIKYKKLDYFKLKSTSLLNNNGIYILYNDQKILVNMELSIDLKSIMLIKNGGMSPLYSSQKNYSQKLIMTTLKKL